MISVLRQYNYRLWATADLISVTGTWMQVLGVNWYLLQATGSPARMGLGIVLQALPALLIGPYAGALADRIRPRPLLIATQVAHAGLAAALAGLAASGGHQIWPVYVISTLSGVVSAIALETLHGDYVRWCAGVGIHATGVAAFASSYDGLLARFGSCETAAPGQISRTPARDR